MQPKTEQDALATVAGQAIKATMQALAGGVPFLNVHPDNKPDGVVICLREAGQLLGSRDADTVRVRETGLLLRKPMVENWTSYLRDGRWDWEHIGPMTAGNLARPVMEALRAMSSGEWHLVPLSITAQLYHHLTAPRRLAEEAERDEAARKAAEEAHQQDVLAGTVGHRRALPPTAPGKQAIPLDKRGVATW